MASKAVAKIAAGGVKQVSTIDHRRRCSARLTHGFSRSLQKQTLQSVGIWERIRRSLAIDPERSNGVPLNPHFRWPTPGGQDPLTYDDPVTAPAGDIADNPYWKRDTRRNYPRLSVVSQADTVALLTVGNAASPKVELIGEEGSKALVAAEAEGQEKGLAKVFEEKGVEAAKELLVDGMPPLLSGQSLKKGEWDVHPWEVTEEQAYPEKYPCRTFH